MLRALRVVFFKEAQDLLRDRRALFFLLAVPVLVPVVILGALLLLSWQVARQAPEGFPVAVDGQEYAPELVARLEENSVLHVVDVPPQPQQALSTGELAALLVVPPETVAGLRDEQPVTVTLTSSRLGWMPLLANLALRDEIAAYDQQLLRERLARRGLDPQWIHPLSLVEGDAPTSGIVAPASEAPGVDFLTRTVDSLLIPFLIASWTMGGGLTLIAHMTVGEKERGTIEPLLVTAANRIGVVLGKISLSMLVSIITLVLWAIYGIGYLLLINLSTTLSAAQPALLGLQAQALGVAGVWLFLLILPLMVAIGGLTAAVCSFARNYREAYLFLTLLQFGLPVLSFVATFLVSANPAPFVYALPVLGVLVAARDLFLGGLPPAMLVLTVVAAVVHAIVSVFFAGHVFSREWALMRGL